jgi:hypothetical protein
MQKADNAVEKGTDTQRADKLYIESNLLRIAGALFCHDQKAARMRTGEIELNAGVIEKHIFVRWTARPPRAQSFRRPHQEAFRLRQTDPQRNPFHTTRDRPPHRPQGVGRSRQRTALPRSP